MKNSIILKIVLSISGVIAMAIALMIQIDPNHFYLANHIHLHGNINLLSEIRAPAMALFTYGLVIFLGIFIARLAFTSTVLSTVLYSSYGVGRILGIIFDGKPTDSLMSAATIEITLGLISLICLIKYTDLQSEPDNTNYPFSNTELL